MLEGGWMTFCSLLIRSFDGFGGEINSWLAVFVAKLSIADVLAFGSLNWLLCVKALVVSVVAEPKL